MLAVRGCTVKRALLADLSAGLLCVPFPCPYPPIQQHQLPSGGLGSSRKRYAVFHWLATEHPRIFFIEVNRRGFGYDGMRIQRNNFCPNYLDVKG